ncbi:APC family permease [Lactococcus lactis]
MKENKLLSPAAIFLLGVNSIIGSGIFLLSGKIYEDAGIWSLLAILCAGLSIFVIAFAYANMSKIYSKNGGAFVYAKETFGRFPGFIVGMVTWLLGTVTLATEVSALLTAMKMILPNLNSRLIGIIIILTLGIISYFGSSIIAGLDNLTSFVKIVLVLVFIFTCLWLVRGLNFLSPNLLIASSANLGGFKGFLSAYGTVFFFFTGFSFLPVNAEKMKNPAKNLPKMMSLVMLTCLAVYLIIQTITIGALGPELTKTLVPAATAFSKIVGSIGIPPLLRNMFFNFWCYCCDHF